MQNMRHYSTLIYTTLYQLHYTTLITRWSCATDCQNLKARWLWSLASSHSTGMAPWTSTPAKSSVILQQDDSGLDETKLQKLGEGGPWINHGVKFAAADRLGNSLELTCVSTCWRTHTHRCDLPGEQFLKCWKKDTMRVTSQDFLVSSGDFTDWISRIAATVEPQKNPTLQTETLWWILLYKQRCCFWIWNISCWCTSNQPPLVTWKCTRGGRGWAVGPQLTCRDFWSIRSSVFGKMIFVWPWLHFFVAGTKL